MKTDDPTLRIPEPKNNRCPRCTSELFVSWDGRQCFCGYHTWDDAKSISGSDKGSLTDHTVHSISVVSVKYAARRK